MAMEVAMEDTEVDMVADTEDTEDTVDTEADMVDTEADMVDTAADTVADVDMAMDIVSISRYLTNIKKVEKYMLNCIASYMLGRTDEIFYDPSPPPLKK